MVTFKVNPDFESLIPPLTDDEFKRLEKSILEEGVRECIITWDGTIIDGHNRYRICQKHGLECPNIERKFPSNDAAKIWIIENQFARRNLGSYVRGALALKLEPLYAAEAKRRMSDGGNNAEVGRQKSDNPIRTDERIANVAGMSRDTIRKVKVIETEAGKGNKTAIDARNDILNKKESIHGAYTRVRHEGDENDIRPLCTICGKPVNADDHYPKDRNKHKRCANKLERENKRNARAKNVRTCYVCGKPIEDGDSYNGKGNLHRKCYNEQLAQQPYRNPDKLLLGNVPVYSVQSLLVELMTSANDLRDTWLTSIEINESMGAVLDCSAKTLLEDAANNLIKTVQTIMKETSNV